MAKIKLVPILIIIIAISIAFAAALFAYNKLQNKPVATVEERSVDILPVAVASILIPSAVLL